MPRASLNYSGSLLLRSRPPTLQGPSQAPSHSGLATHTLPAAKDRPQGTDLQRSGFGVSRSWSERRDKVSYLDPADHKRKYGQRRALSVKVSKAGGQGQDPKSTAQERMGD